LQRKAKQENRKTNVYLFRYINVFHSCRCCFLALRLKLALSASNLYLQLPGYLVVNGDGARIELFLHQVHLRLLSQALAALLIKQGAGLSMLRHSLIELRIENYRFLFRKTSVISKIIGLFRKSSVYFVYFDKLRSCPTRLTESPKR